MPALAAVGAFAASPLGGIVLNLAIGIGASLLANSLSSTSQTQLQSQTPPGVNLSVQVGANTPIQFPVGLTATQGMLSYAGTWGNSGDVPNAFAVWEYVISFLPCPDKPVVWVGNQKCTVDWAATPKTQGYPITDFRVSGVDYAWVQYDDGSQVAAPSYMTGKFGSHPTRPYTTGMVGYGLARARVTLLYKPDQFTTQPDILFETTGIPLYDVSKDSSVGGSGTQRWATPSTWLPSNNPAVQAYNMRRGIFYYPTPANRTGAQWVHGGNNKKDLSAYRLPTSAWIAAIAVANTSVTLSGGGSELQYRSGGVVTGDTMPVTVLAQLAAACSGRICETSGLYKLQAGAPAASVYSFSDANVVTTDGQSFSPFPGLADTYNGVEATYPEPAERWVTKDAPGRYNTTWETQDDGRRLTASATFPMVPYSTQVQRLMQAASNDNRKFRNHIITLPPDAWVLEPGDVVSWTSTRNGYTAKQFLVVGISGRRTYSQVVSLREMDPADYSWSPTGDTIPVAIGGLGNERPPAQAASGLSVFAADFINNSGSAVQPGIGFTYAGGMVDVRAVRFTVREFVSGTIQFDIEIPYDGAVTTGILPHAFVASTHYQVRGDYIPSSSRAHTASSWLDVTTNNVASVTNVTLAGLGQDVRDLLDYGGDGARDMLDAIVQQATGASVDAFSEYTDVQTLYRGIQSVQENVGAQMATLTASYQEAIVAATGPTSALVDSITALYVALGGTIGQVTIRFSTSYTAASGWIERIGLEAFDNSQGSFHSAGIFAEVRNGASRVVLVGSQVVISDDAGDIYALFNSSGEVINGTLRGPGSGNFWNLLTGAFRVSNT